MTNGVVEQRQGLVSVSRHLPIDGDVGFETGNIQFDGSISIRGCFFNIPSKSFRRKPTFTLFMNTLLFSSVISINSFEKINNVTILHFIFISISIYD